MYVAPDLLPALAVAVRGAVDHRRPHPRGADAVDADPLRRQVQRLTARELQQRALAGVVGPALRLRDVGGGTGDVDDRCPGAGTSQRRQCLRDEPRRRLQVHVDRPLPLLLGGVGAAEQEHGRIVDEHVQTPVLPRRGRDRPRTAVLGRDIGDHREEAVPPFVRAARQTFRVEVGASDDRALGEEPRGGGGPDPGRCAGDQDPVVGETIGHALPLCELSVSALRIATARKCGRQRRYDRRPSLTTLTSGGTGPSRSTCAWGARMRRSSGKERCSTVLGSRATGASRHQERDMRRDDGIAWRAAASCPTSANAPPPTAPQRRKPRFREASSHAPERIRTSDLRFRRCRGCVRWGAVGFGGVVRFARLTGGLSSSAIRGARCPTVAPSHQHSHAICRL